MIAGATGISVNAEFVCARTCKVEQRQFAARTYPRDTELFQMRTIQEATSPAFEPIADNRLGEGGWKAISGIEDAK